MSMSTAFCIFAKTVVKQRKTPFEISAENAPFYSSINMDKLRKPIAEMEATGGTIYT